MGLCPCSLTDKALVFGTSNGGSIPSRGTKSIYNLKSSKVS